MKRKSDFLENPESDSEEIYDQEELEIISRYLLGYYILKKYKEKHDLEINVDIDHFKYILGWVCMDLMKTDR